jgi:hypothetical protein
MAKVQVRGCCFGIPFGCGVLLVALLAVLLWRLMVPGSLWHDGAGGALVLLVAVPGAVLLVRAGAGRR